MSDQQQSPQNRYQRGKTVINGNTKHDRILRSIDLGGSILIKLLSIPAISYGVPKILEWFFGHH